MNKKNEIYLLTQKPSTDSEVVRGLSAVSLNLIILRVKQCVNFSIIASIQVLL